MTALVVLATALITAVVTWRTRRQVRDMDTTVQEVHVMVNSQREAILAEVAQLKRALVAAGVAVPPVPPEHGPHN